MKRALLALFFCYAEVADAAINGSTLLRLCTSSGSKPDIDDGGVHPAPKRLNLQGDTVAPTAGLRKDTLQSLDPRH